MRGKAFQARIPQKGKGITPAYAGKRWRRVLSVSMSWDHPRLRGEKGNPESGRYFRFGSPPPTRGKGRRKLWLTFRLRITPAYAGKSVWEVSYGATTKDHPRLRGEKVPVGKAGEENPGSPPPTRGKEGRPGNRFVSSRITPAYAGKSQRTASGPAEIEDHPRLRGEKPNTDTPRVTVEGSPPPTRGQAHLPRTTTRCNRITPAYAGKS